MTQQQISSLLAQRSFSANQEPPKEEVIFRIEFCTIGSLGDYALFTGRPKAGKTKYLSGAMAAAISGEEIFGMKIRLPEGKRRVVHFDTEQGKRSHFNVLNLALKLMGQEVMPAYFESYHCRQDSASTIMAMIDYYLKQYPDTGLLFIDGLLDLIDSFNDEKASKSLVNWLKRITEATNCFVIGVLHRSMSSDKSIGHLGSSADRAAQSVLVVEKRKETGQYILKAEYLRDADDFAPIAIWYNKQLTLWEQVDFIPEEDGVKKPGITAQLKRRPAEYNFTDHAANVARIFNSQALHSYDSLLQRIKEVYNVGRRWATEAVPHLESENIIWRTAEGFTNHKQGKLYKAGS